MATTLVDLIGDVSDAIGTDFDARRTKAYVRHNTSIITTDDGFRLGGGTVNINDDGTFTLPDVVAATTLVENLQATVYIDYTDPTTRQRATATLGPYDLSAETGTVDIRDLEAVQALDPSYVSEFMDQAQALLDESAENLADQIDISGIAVPDALVEALVKNTGGAGPLTSAALAEGYAEKLGNTSTSTSGAAAINKLTMVDASAGAKTMTLADGTATGQQAVIEKTDTSANTVTITGKIRTTGAGSAVLSYQYQTIVLLWRGTQWEPVTNNAPLPARGRHPLTGMYHVEGYGAVGDNSTDCTAAINAAIADAAAATGGGKVYFATGGTYRCSGVVHKSNVTLFGQDDGPPYVGNTLMCRVILRANAGAAPVVTDDGSHLLGAGVVGIGVQGFVSGTTYASEGFKFTYTDRCTFKSFGVVNTTGSGFKVLDGVASRFIDGIVVGACLNRSPGALTGAFDIAGTDHYVERVEGTCSTTSVESAADTNFYLAGIVVRGANGTYLSVIGEISTVGIYITSAAKYNKFSNTRADLNWAHGWINEGNRNGLTSCASITNGRLTANTYSGFKTTGYGNAHTACMVHGDSGSVKFGFEDALAGNISNAYDPSCLSTHHATAAFSFATFLGASLGVAKIIRPANGTTSINVEGAAVVDLASYSTPTTVTAFANGVGGQTIRVLGDPDVTIQNNSTILTNTTADKVLAGSSVYTFTLNNAGVWVEGADDGRSRRLATVTGIDAKTTGTTTLYTVPTGKTAVITAAIIRCTAASAITVAPTLGIGVAAGEDDIFTSTALTGLTATTKEWHAAPTGLTVKVPAAAVIKVGIDTAATGTSQTLAIDLVGYLV